MRRVLGLRVLPAVVALSTVLSSAAWACRDNPIAAGEAWSKALAACDFVGAFRLLHPSDQAAADGGMVGWTRQQTQNALENVACHSSVDEVSPLPSTDPKRAIVQVVSSTPISIMEFRNLLERRRYAPVRDWGTIDSAINQARGRLLVEGAAGPRMTSAASLELEHFEADGVWCVFLGLAEERLIREFEARSRAQAARAATEARQALQARTAAALSAVSVGEVGRGRSASGETGVGGEVVNGSRETLKRITIRIDFLNVGGQVVAERRHAVVIDAGLDPSPLPPGHRRRWGYRTSDITPAWTGNVLATVIEVEIQPAQ